MTSRKIKRPTFAEVLPETEAKSRERAFQYYFVGLYERALSDFALAKQKFVKDFMVNPATAMEWKTEKVLEQQETARLWMWAMENYAIEGGNHVWFLSWVLREVERMTENLLFAPWKSRSTCVVTNLAEVMRAAALAQYVRDLRSMIKYIEVTIERS